MLKIENLNVHFGDFHALKDVSLEIPDGEFFTLLGPSGCGKTTTLRSITGFIKPSSGKITIDGRDITNIPVEKRNIGMVFQSYALFPTMTVYENIAFSLKVQKKNKVEIDRIVHDCAKKVDLTDEQLVKNVSELSGGQQQRVAIARALALDPDILCFDEPTSALDPELTGDVLKVIRSLSDRKMTMIIVTHEMRFAEEVSDRILFIADGNILEDGTPEQVFHNPKHPRLQDFLSKVL